MPGSDDVNPASSGVKLTYDDFVQFPDDGQRHELIDGVHYVTPSPNLGHQDFLGRLHLIMAGWLEEHPVGKVFFAPLDVILSRFDVVEPDLLYVSNERAPALLAGDWVTGAPDLVVEIISPSTRKREETLKRSLYERVGVLEYWVCDPKTKAFHLYVRKNDRFELTAERSHAKNDVLTTPLLAGLEIPLARVFRD